MAPAASNRSRHPQGLSFPQHRKIGGVPAGSPQARLAGVLPVGSVSKSQAAATDVPPSHLWPRQSLACGGFVCHRLGWRRAAGRAPGPRLGWPVLHGTRRAQARSICEPSVVLSPRWTPAALACFHDFLQACFSVCTITHPASCCNLSGCKRRVFASSLDSRQPELLMSLVSTRMGFWRGPRPPPACSPTAEHRPGRPLVKATGLLCRGTRGRRRGPPAPASCHVPGARG